MRGACAILGAALLLGATSVRAADDIPALLARKHCNACHDMESTLIGPSYIAIATRYRAGDRGIVEVLALKTVLGGGGNWGVVPMVPNEHVTLEEARAIVKWLLELEPAGTSG
jgi:cytochrome c